MSDEKDETPQRKGGRARAAKLTPEQRVEIGRTGAAARWGLPRAEYEGELHIPGVVPLKVANLADGRRVLNSRAFLAALGRPWKGTYARTERPNFIDARNLDAFVTDEVRALLEPVDYINKHGQKASGYQAELLPVVCDVYLRARLEPGVLSKSQERVADFAEVLVRGLARVGIVSLVDDATGYAKVRARTELQSILSAYISAELLPWERRFPATFYEQLYRVRGWKYEPTTNARTQYVGKLTNELIYKQLPPGVLDELRALNPRDPDTKRRKRTHHELLTPQIGHPHLEKQIVAVTTLLSVSDDWEEFLRLFAKRFKPPPGDLFSAPPA